MNFLSIKNRSIIAQRLFFVAILFVASLLCAADRFFAGPLTTVSALGYGKDVYVVQDQNNAKFILKYNTKNNYITPSPEPSIHEAFGAAVGIAAGININDVRLFPAHDTTLQSVDMYPHMPKTLHTLVPGTEVDNATIPYHINIYGALRDRGNLASLTYHKHLCQIAALDLFLSNPDRHNGNLFVNSEANQFYAIDMDWIFNQIYNFSNDNKDKDTTLYSSVMDYIRSFQKKSFPCYVLATETYEFLQNIKPNELSDKEIEALKEINATLEKLQSIYPPKKLFTEWMNIAQQAHYTYSTEKQQYIRYLIAYNYHEISKIRAQINKLISNNSFPSYLQQISDRANLAWQATKLHSFNIVF